MVETIKFTVKGIKSKDAWLTFLHLVKPTFPWIAFGILLLVLKATAIKQTYRPVIGLQNTTYDDGKSLPPQFSSKIADQGEEQYQPDPRFNYPFHKEIEQLPTMTAAGILTIPFALNILLVRPTAIVYHATATLVTFSTIGVLKKAVGAIRPNFFQRCGYNATTGMCKSEADMSDDEKEYLSEVDGRHAFPSGHSGNAAVVMVFWALDWVMLIGATWPRCRAFVSIFATIPLTLMVWIAWTRYVDFFHFPHDILAGIAIGAPTAYFFFKTMRTVRKEAEEKTAKNMHDASKDVCE